MRSIVAKKPGFSFKKVCLPVILVITLSGCVPKVYLKPRADFPEKVAVLMMTNYTNDLQGPIFVRALFHNRLSGRGYSPMPMEEVDELLRKEGISEGGQLAVLSPKLLGEILKVEGLFYGDLIEFNYINLGFYTNRLVRVRFKFVKADTEERLWEKEDRVATSNLTFKGEEVKKAFVEGIGKQIAEKMLRSPLKKETEKCVEKILKALPRRGQ